MAKDPAMLWYWNDWHSGTGLLTRFLKGCYMDLLHLQFNNGRLSLDNIRFCLGSDFGQAWPTLQSKFKQDENGLFFNERLEHEKKRREAYSESRRKNKVPKQTHDASYDTHMISHMENENCIELSKGVLRGKGPTMDLELPDIKQGAIIELFLITKNQRASKEQVLSLWRIFKIQNIGQTFYSNNNEAYKHFFNWCKTQNIESKNGHQERFVPSGPPLPKI